MMIIEDKLRRRRGHAQHVGVNVADPVAARPEQEPVPLQELAMVDDEMLNLIDGLPNWKAVGNDRVYNFFIKRCTALHPYIVRKIIALEVDPGHWFYSGITYLLPMNPHPQRTTGRSPACRICTS
jgi:hypothetical protein